MKGIYVVTFERGQAFKKEIRKALRAAGLKGVTVINGRQTKSIYVEIPQEDGSDICTKYRPGDDQVEINSFVRPVAVSRQVGD